LHSNVRLPGQYYDSESGLHYNWHRYYDPSIGRYLRSDPIGLAGGVNTYGYAYQNPLIYFDFIGFSGNNFISTSDSAYATAAAMVSNTGSYAENNAHEILAHGFEDGTISAVNDGKILSQLVTSV